MRQNWWLWVVLSVLSTCPVLGAPDLVFAVFGDSRPGNAAFSPVLAALAQDMAQVGPKFVLGTGDYIEGARTESSIQQQWGGFFQALSPLRQLGVPVALAPGNHEIRGSRRFHAIFEEYFGNSYRSFNAGPYHFVVLDTEEPGRSGRIAGEQLDWLKRDLDRHRDARLTFVALHQPLFPSGPHKGSSLDAHPRERDALHKLFASQGVDVVFAGHEHLFHRHQKDGVDYVITGGAGAPLYAKPENGGFHHYVLARLYGGDCRMSLRKLGGSG